jgi:class 3 adenylate cyclase/tetratricopeptide (TPR) repeat protein
MTQPRAAITTILFTDLIGSTELLQQVGDEQGQRIFQQHHKLLSDVVTTTSGQELQWLGDGLMAAFPSTADAVRSAVAMQRASAQPVLGHRLDIRVGLNVGEVLTQDRGGPYFGTPLVVARRLCDRAGARQILCSSTVAGLLNGRQAFRFRDLGPLALKGITAPVPASEVLYDAESPTGFLTQTPFVGRRDELARLTHHLERAEHEQGGLVMVVGEPGIGKTRTTEEFAAQARERGARVLWGRCYEGEGAPPYGPFAEAIGEYAGRAAADELRTDLSQYGAAVAGIAPLLKERVPDLPELPALQPDEERYRLFDAVAQFVLATARRAPVLLVLDDLHWADGGSIALLRHLARVAGRNRLLIVGAYRDVELDRQHPLAEALAMLKRETEYERIPLKGLGTDAIGELLTAIANQEVPDAWVQAISAETSGNPFFIREVLLHLVEEKKLYRAEGQWRSDLTIAQLGIPEGVRQVIGRRLSRLSEAANRLLSAASAFDGGFRFEVAWRAAQLEEAAALDAVDQALDAQVLRATGEPDTYDFTHALIRHTLYSELNPSRQVRLHRRIAEVMEEVYGDRAAEHAGEIAEHYHRSAALPGAERGVAHCLAAAEQAEQAAAYEEVAVCVRMALDLLSKGDPQRPRLLARLGLALAWSFQVEEAARVAAEAGELIAASEGSDSAAHYLADIADAIWLAHRSPLAWPLAEQGLRYIESRRDFTWARLAAHAASRRDAEDPGFPGMPIDSPERRAISRVIFEHWSDFLAQVAAGSYGELVNFLVFASRDEVLERASGVPGLLGFWAGDYRGALPFMRGITEFTLQRGQFSLAAFGLTIIARLESALGDLAASTETFAQANAVASRLPVSQFLRAQMAVVPAEHAFIRGEGFDEYLRVAEDPVVVAALENRWALAAIRCAAACSHAHERRRTEAIQGLAGVLPAIEHAVGSAPNYTALIGVAADTLWTLERTDHIEVIERNLRAKTIAPDFRYPHVDGRLSLARLCALQGRYDEAVEWFAKARTVLHEQGARPLRAVADFDEALMYARRGAPGDRERALRLLDLAVPQFEAIGMPGWIRRAEELRRGVLRASESVTQ